MFSNSELVKAPEREIPNVPEEKPLHGTVESLPQAIVEIIAMFLRLCR
jgi:hypothetical protein